MSWVGLTVDFDAKFFRRWVGAKVDAGAKESSNEAAGIIVAVQSFARQLDEGGFGTIGYELNRIDEVFSGTA